jgi:hypothetical protein
MASLEIPAEPKDAVEIVLDKLAIMREELLTIERALERMQREAGELEKRQFRTK